MATIYILYFQSSICDIETLYYFTSIPHIVHFLNKEEQKRGAEWQTVIVIQANSNKNKSVYIKGHKNPVSTFIINKFGDTRPMNEK